MDRPAHPYELALARLDAAMQSFNFATREATEAIMDFNDTWAIAAGTDQAKRAEEVSAAAVARLQRKRES